MSGAPLRRPGENYGIYLVDAFGNKELIYRDPDIGCMNPIPLAAPAAARRARQHARGGPGRQGGLHWRRGPGDDGGRQRLRHPQSWPEGTKIKSLRVLQLLPCAVPSGGLRPHETGKRIAEAGDSVVPCRWVLGTVPVEEDGSAHFTVPAYRELFFQALDERGMAITSMRSATSCAHGETLVCQGCHEHKVAGEPAARRAAAGACGAARRRPCPTWTAPIRSAIRASSSRCSTATACSATRRTRTRRRRTSRGSRSPTSSTPRTTRSCNYGFTAYGDNYRTRPGQFGARASKLIEILDKGHHDVKLSAEDFHRLALWIDCCSMFYGVFEKEPGEAQLRGEVARAILE